MKRIYSLLLACLVLFLMHCKPRKFNEAQQNSSPTAQIPVFAFWDSGRNPPRGLDAMLIQGNNIKNMLNLSDPGKYRARVVHMNPSEFDENYLMNVLRPEDFPARFRDFFLNKESLDPATRQFLEAQKEAARGQLPKEITDDPAKIEQALTRIEESTLLRLALSTRMTKSDLIQYKTTEFTQWLPTSEELYKKAAVPLSDFVRLALLTKYGGIWVDATISINTDLDYFFNSLKAKNKDLFLYYNPWYRQDRSLFPVEEIRSIAAAETWWMVTPTPGHPMVRNWLENASDYWMQKTKGQDISQHPLFLKNSSNPNIDVQKIPAYLRNYLWIYLCWTRAVAKDASLAEARVLGADAFENPIGLGGQNAVVGPYVWMLYSNMQNAGLSAFVGEHATKREGPYLRWIDKMKILKIPGAVATDLKEIYESQDEAMARASVFKYIWSKKRQNTFEPSSP
jgi:hypothetical protein